jgi:hypothetical protein
MPEHQPGFEILTKHKEAIRQLYTLAKWGPVRLGRVYHVTRWTISRILRYDNPERARPTRIGKPRCLNEKQVYDIIEYICESYKHRHLDYLQIQQELHLNCSPKIVERMLKEQGYFRCIVCQKPYLTYDQAMKRWIYSIKHLFWKEEWYAILWSNECTFLIGGRRVKERVTRKRGERFHPTCIQFQLHRGYTTPINVWGAIGYNYKSECLFVKGEGKKGAFTQKDYLEQVLKPAIEGIIEDFGYITAEIKRKPTSIEDSNPAYRHKSIHNPCADFRRRKGITLLDHPSTSPDLNPIEKCW